MDRRDFIRMTAGAATLPLLARGRGSAAAPLRLDAVLTDERFAQSRAFGAAGERLGIRRLAMDGDITSIWYRELDPLWRRGPSFVAGLTTRQALVCLERLAWDRGLRVRHARPAATEPAGGMLVSWLIAPPERQA